MIQEYRMPKQQKHRVLESKAKFSQSPTRVSAVKLYEYV